MIGELHDRDLPSIRKTALSCLAPASATDMREETAVHVRDDLDGGVLSGLGMFGDLHST